VIWGKTQKVRSQETGKRIYRRKLPSEWRRREIPEQRIVSEELWAASRRRMQLVEQLYDCGPGRRPNRGRAAGSPYRFTGLLECSICRGSITIVSGQWRKRDDSRYGCSMHAYRGDRVCRNNLLITRSLVEGQLLAGFAGEGCIPMSSITHPRGSRSNLRGS
jgi:site-specific DNA recombinase